MFSIKDVAEALGLKPNTFRYWIQKNKDDFDNNNYNFNLFDLIHKIKIVKNTLSKRKIKRAYLQYIVLDLDEFKKEFERYIGYIEDLKKKKRIGNISWTDSAIDCYNCNMNCTECMNRRICAKVITIEGEPPMKLIVKKLLSQIGKPPNQNFYN